MITNCPVCGKLTCIHWPEHWVYRRGSAYYCSDLCMDAAMVKDMNAINEAVKRRKELAMTKITLEQKKKAVELAIIGENPLPYLKKCGSNAPDKTWYAIKAALKEKDPETYAKIPDFRAKAPRYGDVIPGFVENETEQTPTVKVDGPIRIQTETPDQVEVEPAGTLADAMNGMQKAADMFFGACEEMGLDLNKDEEKEIDIKVEHPNAKPLRKLKPGLRGLNNSDFDVSAIRHPVFGEFYYDQKFGMVDWRTPEGEEVSLSPKNWKELYLIIPDVMGILGVPDDE